MTDHRCLRSLCDGRDVSRSDEVIESFLDLWRDAEEACRDVITHGRQDLCILPWGLCCLL